MILRHRSVDVDASVTQIYDRAHDQLTTSLSNLGRPFFVKIRQAVQEKWSQSFSHLTLTLTLTPLLDLQNLISLSDRGIEYLYKIW